MPSIADELERLAKLRDQNVLTQEEFEAEKAKILASSNITGDAQKAVNYNTVGASRPSDQNVVQRGLDEPPPPTPQTFMIHSIIATLFCCLPLGIVAITKSSAVTTAYAQKRYNDAQRLSDEAKMWVNISVVAGIFTGIFLAVLL